MLFYSLNWTKKKSSHPKNLNRTTIQISGIICNGENISLEKEYDEWLAVCTNNIDKTITQIQYFFPGINLTYELLNDKQYKKVLPNFAKRLGRKVSSTKHFYKVYSNNAYINDISTVMDKYKLSYYRPEDWLIRIFIDLCLEGASFYYRWYDVGNSKMLLESMKINSEYREKPNINIAAFDLKIVCTDNANRFPTGCDEHDKIVMISLVKWNYCRCEKTEKLLLYLNPLSDSVHDRFQKLSPDVEYLEFFNEKELLERFHATLSHCHILTGYNINNFDLPCLLARVVLLNMTNELKMYSSKRIGTHVITTVENRMVLDMYHFIQLFSKQDLISCCDLDDVAKYKLNRSAYPFKNSLHYYYSDLIKTTDILLSSDKKYLYGYLKPNRLEFSEFGTFLDCLSGCMENSISIYLLFNHELALAFLVERANATALDIESSFYLSNSKYILSVFLTTGIRLQFFININYFHNSVEEDLVKYRKFLVRRKNNSYTYQGGLNFGIPGTFYKNVAILDFLSMYSSILVNQNLSYETSGLIDTDTFLNLSDEIKEKCFAVPYSQHSENEILLDNYHSSRHELPKIDAQKHELLMVSFKNEMGFLPSVMNEFLEKRKNIQRQYKQHQSTTLYVRQLNIKFFLNAASGCLGSVTFPMGCVDIPMMITCYARIFLLGASHFAQHVLGCSTVYSDTDSLFLLDYDVHKGCDIINRYLNQKWILLQMEKHLSCLLILSKKKYIFREKNHTGCKLIGFEKQANGISKWVANHVASEILSAMERNESSASHGWVIWTNALIRAFVMASSNPKAFYLTKKIQQADVETSNKYTYCQADVSKWASEKMIITHLSDCKEVNFEKLFPKKLLIRLLNAAFFNLHCPAKPCNKVLNTMRWKSFVNTDFTCMRKFKKPILILVLKSVKKYTFELNECFKSD